MENLENNKNLYQEFLIVLVQVQDKYENEWNEKEMYFKCQTPLKVINDTIMWL